MGIFQLEIKKSIPMEREGSDVGDVLIKMSEWPGHHSTLSQICSNVVINRPM